MVYVVVLMPYPEGSMEIVQIYNNKDEAKLHVEALKEEFNLTKECLGTFGFYNDDWAAYIEDWVPKNKYEEGGPEHWASQMS